jgi:ABC-type Fe3+-hydroxamate transport system substrate-binding protein
MIRGIGEITHRITEGNNLIESIQSEFLHMAKLPPLKTLYLIWQNPWMGVGSGTFIHSMMQATGLRNVLESNSRYPELSEEQLRSLSPEVILLSSEPYPFAAKHIAGLQQLCPKATTLLVDGELFSWYGSRLLKFPAYTAQLATKLL